MCVCVFLSRTDTRTTPFCAKVIRCGSRAHIQIYHIIYWLSALPPFSKAKIHAESYSRVRWRSSTRNRCESLRYTLTISYAHNVGVPVPAAADYVRSMCTRAREDMQIIERCAVNRESSMKANPFSGERPLWRWCTECPQTALLPTHSSINPDHRFACARRIDGGDREARYS